MIANQFRTMGAWILLICSLAIGSKSYAQAGGPPQGAAPGGTGGAQAEEANPPVIDSIEIKGSTKFKQSEMMKALAMKVGDTISRTKVKDSCNNIAALYQKQGGDAAVSPNITHPSDGHVQVYLTVDESGKGGFSFHP
jgi:outer membrane protein assembly factor BamA